MLNEELATIGLAGSYRDVLRDDAGRVTWDSGWKKNQILINCRRLIAAFMRGESNTLGIRGLKVGAGDPTWDLGMPPAPQPTDKDLVAAGVVKLTIGDPALKLDYLDANSGVVSNGPTQRLQITATLGPSVATETLREFGLVGQLGGQEIVINLVRHVAIVKDPVSTLVRTIQLVF
jgi:hypothetical protein